MFDRDTVRKALDLALQAGAYSQLGAVGVNLAQAARADLAAATAGWPEAAVKALTTAAIQVDRERSALDRARNHFIKDFRLRFSTDPAFKAKLDAAIADFTRRKQQVLDDVAGRLFSDLHHEETTA